MTIKMTMTLTDALEYFESQGLTCPRKCNPADFLLDIATKYSNQNSIEDGFQLKKMIRDSDNDIEFSNEEISWNRRKVYSPYWLDQVALLSKRTFQNSLRNPNLLRLQYAVTIITALLVGLIFYKLTYDSKGAQDRFGVLFFLLALISFSNMSAIDVCKWKKLWSRDFDSFPRTGFDGPRKIEWTLLYLGIFCFQSTV
jgi:hypothetical protein